VGLGSELRVSFFLFVGGSHLLGRRSTAQAMLPALFALVTLEMGSHVFFGLGGFFGAGVAQAGLDSDPPILCFPPS
jgi:hypothetical protein